MKSLKDRIISFFASIMVVYFFVTGIWIALVLISKFNLNVVSFTPVIFLWATILMLYIKGKVKRKRLKAIPLAPLWERIFSIILVFATMILWGLIIVVSGYNELAVNASPVIAIVVTMIALIANDRGWGAKSFKFFKDITFSLK